ncbi:cell cycle regulator of non-homologous end joining [Anomaloglossus baeobatrachus]|uniref:cell cycle regulator of non-homologous end joining n=1 Tax=Anomaloglossus baeobatrachus TaxID=238106 RepID=UPI003F5058A8
MDVADSAVKRRVLPAWMTDDHSAAKKPHTAEPWRRKTPVVSGSSRKKTVYCMNEKELVECALEVLSRGKEERKDKEKTKAEDYKEAAPSPDTGSEKKPPTSPGSERPRTPPPSCNDSHDPDNDPLKYVREIFFS